MISLDKNAFKYCLLNDILLKQPAKEHSDTVNQGFTALASLKATFETCQGSQGDAGFQDKLRGICISRERPSGSQCLLCNRGAVLPTNITKDCTQNLSFAASIFTFSS